jgi:hypothetical protein
MQQMDRSTASATRPAPTSQDTPSIAVVLPAYNEAALAAAEVEDGPVEATGPDRPAADGSRLWARLGLAGVVLLAAILYCWALPRNGMGNEYYTAAALSGASGW